MRSTTKSARFDGSLSKETSTNSLYFSLLAGILPNRRSELSRNMNEAGLQDASDHDNHISSIVLPAGLQVASGIEPKLPFSPTKREERQILIVVFCWIAI